MPGLNEYWLVIRPSAPPSSGTINALWVVDAAPLLVFSLIAYYEQTG